MWAVILQIVNYVLQIADRLTGFWIKRSDENQKKRDDAQRRMDEASKSGDYDAYWDAYADKHSK